MALGDVIARLAVQLNLDVASFEAGAKKSAGTTKTLGDKMDGLKTRMTAIGGAVASAGAVIAGSAFVGQLRDMATAGLDHASALGEQAQQLGVTTSELQRYRFMATQVGIDQEVMDKGLSKLTITLGDLANGAKAPTAALERLGLSQSDIARVSAMTAGAAIPFLADSFAKLKSPTEAAAIAADLFGAKLGPKFMTLLSGGSTGINQLADAYKRLGIELTPEQIAKADEAMDMLAAQQEVLKAKTAQIAVDNSDALIKGTEAWERFKISSVAAFGGIVEGIDFLNSKYVGGQQAQRDFYLSTASSLRAWSVEQQTAIANFAQRAKAIFEGIPAYIGAMVSRIATFMTGKLNAVWDGALAKIETVKKAFFGLYDAVVGHSYVPDMVDGIAQQMARLDAVMVNPAKSATERAKQSFEKLASDIQGIMRRLFPDAATEAGFINDRASLEAGIKGGGAGGYTVAQLQEALKALQSEQFKEAFKDFQVSANDNASKVEAANVRVIKSFKDMADETLGALQNLSNSIKGGGFLDILGSVLGLGLQLGSIGAFGKTIQTRVNAVPAHATGTPYAARGLALVGERGPELVNLRGGESVYSNANSRALMSGGSARVIIEPTPYFNAVVDGRAANIAGPMSAQAAGAGSSGAQVAIARQRSRSIP